MWLRRKQWKYIALVTDEVLVAVCVVDLGYAASAFFFAYDAKSKAMLCDASAKALRSDVSSARAIFRSRDLRVAILIEGDRWSLTVGANAVALDASMVTESAPPPIVADVSVPRGGRMHTEKRALLTSSGTLHVSGRKLSLNGFGGYDVSYGQPARHTQWNWAFFMGRDTSGDPIAMNLVSGFIGAPECAIFHRGGTRSIPEGRFTINGSDWTIDAGDVSLRFAAGAEHRQEENLLVVRSKFIQPVGLFSGHVGKTEIQNVLGVTEDQDVLW